MGWRQRVEIIDNSKAQPLLSSTRRALDPVGLSRPGIVIEWKPLIMITLGLALFDNNNRLIILSRGYKNLHYLTQFIVTVQPFTIKIRGLNC
jgi:hypothetical protein